MKEIKGDLWKYFDKEGYVILITTNGTIKANGEAVMGKGCAKEAVERLPDFPGRLGEKLKSKGNVLNRPFGNDDEYPEDRILTFPVKHHWWQTADLDLIEMSAKKLARFVKESPDFKFVLPRPGCGNGGLRWKDVRKVIAPILTSNRILVISKIGAK